MAEIAFDGIYNEGPRFDDEWGLDGWTSRKMFKLLITGEDNSAIAHLNVEQCSQLAAVLIEHVKEVRDASEKNTS